MYPASDDRAPNCRRHPPTGAAGTSVPGCAGGASGPVGVPPTPIAAMGGPDGTVGGVMDAVEEAAVQRPRRRFALVASGAAIVVLLAALVATFVLGSDGENEPEGGPPATGATPNRPGAPDVEAMLDTELLTPDGRTVTLRGELDGRPILVNQWSKTCAPCVEEMPWLEQVSRTNRHVKVLGVNNLDGLGAATTRAKQTGITYRWVRDPDGDFAHAARTVGLPDTMLFSADGTLLASKIGKFDDLRAIQDFVDEHVEQADRTPEGGTP